MRLVGEIDHVAELFYFSEMWVLGVSRMACLFWGDEMVSDAKNVAKSSFFCLW